MAAGSRATAALLPHDGRGACVWLCCGWLETGRKCVRGTESLGQRLDCHGVQGMHGLPPWLPWSPARILLTCAGLLVLQSNVFPACSCSGRMTTGSLRPLVRMCRCWWTTGGRSCTELPGSTDRPTPRTTGTGKWLWLRGCCRLHGFAHPGLPCPHSQVGGCWRLGCCGARVQAAAATEHQQYDGVLRVWVWPSVREQGGPGWLRGGGGGAGGLAGRV